MKKKIILVGIDPLNGNRGVGALAYSIFYLLNEISKKDKIDLDIQILGFSNKVRQYKISINNEDIPITYLPFDGGKGIKRNLKFLFYLLFSFRKILKTKYILDIGAGDSFSDIYGEDRFYWINFPKIFFRKLNKKQLLLPQTIGPFKTPKIAKEAKKSIEKCEMVMARDKMSYNYVIENTSQKDVKELIDIAFFMPYNKKTFNNSKINIGLNISSLMWHGGYTQKNQFGLNFSYQDVTKKIIDYFLSIPNVQIHLIPHVVLPTTGIENDYEISQFILDEYNDERITLAPFFLNPIDAKNYISGLDFFTGARMHACIAAFSSGVPAYPIAYSRKFNGLFEETLQYPYIGDLINQTMDDFYNGLEYAFQNRNILSDKIHKSMETIVHPRYNILVEELKRFLEI